MARLRSRPYPWSFSFPVDIDSQVKIIFVNARSMHLHKDDIATDANFTQSDIIFCCETRYYPSEPDTLYDIDGFSCHRYDDESSNGPNRPALGMAAYYSKFAANCEFINFSQHKVDTISTSLTLLDGSKCKIIAVYKKNKASTTNLIKTLEYCLSDVDISTEPVIILGDFNHEPNECENDIPRKLKRQFLEKYGFSVLIKQPTNNFRRTIDNIFTNIASVKSGILQTYFSDHKAVWIAL